VNVIATRPIPIDKDAIRKIVSAVVRALPNHLRVKPDDMDSPLWMARGYSPDRWGFYPNVPEITISRPWLDQPMPLPEGSWPDTVDVRGREVVVMFRVGAKKDPKATPDGPRYYVYGGQVGGDYGTAVQPREYKEPNRIEVFINSARTPRELLDNMDEVGRELFSVLIHEATHLRDLVRQHPKGYGDSPATYHNDPAEVRAFMQQVADEVSDAVRASGDPTGVSVSAALRSSRTWRRIEPTLTPANRRLILRGVGTVVSEITSASRVATAWLRSWVSP
jgi:hypothetical protein